MIFAPDSKAMKQTFVLELYIRNLDRHQYLQKCDTNVMQCNANTPIMSGHVEKGSDILKIRLLRLQESTITILKCTRMFI